MLENKIVTESACIIHSYQCINVKIKITNLRNNSTQPDIQNSINNPIWFRSHSWTWQEAQHIANATELAQNRCPNSQLYHKNTELENEITDLTLSHDVDRWNAF